MSSDSNRPTPSGGVMIGASVTAIFTMIATWAGTDPIFATAAAALAVVCVVHLAVFVAEDRQSRTPNHP